MFFSFSLSLPKSCSVHPVPDSSIDRYNLSSSLDCHGSPISRQWPALIENCPAATGPFSRMVSSSCVESSLPLLSVLLYCLKVFSHSLGLTLPWLRAPLCTPGPVPDPFLLFTPPQCFLPPVWLKALGFSLFPDRFTRPATPPSLSVCPSVAILWSFFYVSCYLTDVFIFFLPFFSSRSLFFCLRQTFLVSSWRSFTCASVAPWLDSISLFSFRPIRSIFAVHVSLSPSYFPYPPPLTSPKTCFRAFLFCLHSLAIYLRFRNFSFLPRKASGPFNFSSSSSSPFFSLPLL